MKILNSMYILPIAMIFVAKFCSLCTLNLGLSQRPGLSHCIAMQPWRLRCGPSLSTLRTTWSLAISIHKQAQKHNVNQLI